MHFLQRGFAEGELIEAIDFYRGSMSGALRSGLSVLSAALAVNIDSEEAEKNEGSIIITGQWKSVDNIKFRLNMSYHLVF